MTYLERVGAAYCALEAAKRERAACHKTLRGFFIRVKPEDWIPNRDFKAHPTPRWTAAYDRWTEAKVAMEAAAETLQRVYLEGSTSGPTS